MKAFTIPLRLIMILGLTFSYEANANRNDDLSACNGTLMGNAAYDISVGNDDVGRKILKLAFEPYLEFLFRQDVTSEEMKVLDVISGSSSDSVTLRINSEVYGNDDYELYVKCLIDFGNLAIEMRDTEPKVREMAMYGSQKTIEKIFRIIKAGN